LGHLQGLVPVQVGHSHQFRFRQGGVLFRMETAQITHAYYSHFDRFGHGSTHAQKCGGCRISAPVSP